jgi:hypothetical protein
MAGRTILDVLREQLQVRVIAGPSPERIVLDATKDLDGWLVSTEALLRWTAEAFTELAALNIDARRFVDASLCAAALDRIEEHVGFLRRQITLFSSE